jgi:type IV secretion system protein VirD4
LSFDTRFLLEKSENIRKILHHLSRLANKLRTARACIERMFQPLADQPPGERRLSRLFDLFTADDVDYQLAVMLDKKEVSNRAAKAAITAYLQLSDRETRPSVLGTVQTLLRLFDSDVIRKATDTTTMDLDAFVAGKPMSLYLIVPPFKLNAYRPLLRLWLTGLILLLTQRKQRPQERTLMLCDEVGNLGRIDALLTAATLLRSWGLTLWSFWQNAGNCRFTARRRIP